MKEQGKISFWAAVLMSVNIIVGGGIFAGPKLMTAVAGNVSFLSWLITAVILFPIIWGISQAARIFPGAGGFYNYCATGINPTFGFIAQWAYLLGYMGTGATMITLLKDGFINRLGFTIVAEHPYLFNAVVIAFFALLNLMSVSKISKIQSSVTLLKLLPIFFVIAMLPFYWNSSMSYPAVELAAIPLTLSTAIFGYWGFEACCSLGHLLKDGPQAVGKVILTAFFISSALYTSFHLGLLNIMGASNLASQGPTTVQNFMGLSPSVTSLIAVAIVGSILLSYANSIFGLAFGNVTNIFTLAERKLILGDQALTQTSGIGRPTIANIVYGIAIWALLFFISNIKILMAFTNIGVCTAFVLTLVALLLTYLRSKNYVQVFITMLGFLSCAVLLFYCWHDIGEDTATRLMYSSPLIIGTIFGLIMFKIQQSKKLSQ